MVSRHAAAERRIHIACAVIAVCAMALVLRPLSAAESSTAAEAPAISSASETFIVGNVTFALLHEFGHAIIRDFDVPLLGLEEESADTIAAVSLIRLDVQHPNAGFGEMLGVTALAQAYVWKAGLEREGAQVALWAQHGLSAQRYARLLCLLYGSDAKRFGWVAEAAEMQEIRAESCEDEWNIAERGSLWVRDTYGIPPSQRSSRPAAEIGVKYAQPLDANETKLAKLIQGRQLLEKLGQQMQTTFAFPESLTLKLSHCRIPNAYWDDEYREVVLCYELMEALAKYSQQPEVTKVVERFRAGR
ncbi:MAG TPA: DUF4344 domain-containing metallopeptidase [Steroidobacteraceae bacterium]